MKDNSRTEALHLFKPHQSISHFVTSAPAVFKLVMSEIHDPSRSDQTAGLVKESEIYLQVENEKESIHEVYDRDGNILPTEKELKTLRRVTVPLPWTAYLLCIVELAERGSYFGCRQVFANFVNNPRPVGGNG
jgi:hypothetical protein